ncbi:hypothetical protein Cha6605_0521 [Chamaesiphon minutus PCC 6605]|uniref:Uncharacterized protein n=2 Tax=Chamaesiphon TaxID=217161 RepID=K9UB16_CHAP6|nr:hypothetical protein Cha6605_0521 [Chamaesiphon minutus PCC 6605]
MISGNLANAKLANAFDAKVPLSARSKIALAITPSELRSAVDAVRRGEH